MATKFTKPVNVNAPGKDVVFDGVDFTEDALITLTAANSVTFKNCRFYRWNPDKAKTMPITGPKDVTIKLVFEHCFFGPSDATETGKIYNLFELNTVLADGSSISNNWFVKDAYTHNGISAYAVEDCAEVAINGNHWDYSGNAIRLGLKGSPKCNINMIGNEYDATDLSDNGEWAGLLLIQPYGKQTVTFNDMVVRMYDTVNKSEVERVLYLYAGSSDQPFDKSANYPKVYIDGEYQDDLYAAGGTVVADAPAAE